jgi:hypothetical protein
MRNRRAKPPDRLARLFLDIAGEVPDDASLLRMQRISTALNLRDNDALWSVLAMLEHYARLYVAMPERIRWAAEGSLEAARREVGGETDALMQQHRAALERCKATIQLAENLMREHEARYRAALATLNEAALTALIERVANQATRATGNRLIGAAAISAREQRERLDGAMKTFEQSIEMASARLNAVASRMERRFARALLWLLVMGAAVLCLLLVDGGLARGLSHAIG